jgi:hypothetical protein
MDGYKRVPASWSGVVQLIGDRRGRPCGECPRDKDGSCRSFRDCDAGNGMVWVPDHIYVIWMVNASDEEKQYLADWVADPNS